jgi:hypothetical protein
MNESLIPVIGLVFKQLKCSFSFDYTTSGLRSFNQSKGATEFNLISLQNYLEKPVAEMQCPTP